MRYIRTKDGIYDTTKGLYTPSIKMFAIGTKTIYNDDIIKQADTIEELCDEFVFNSDVSSYVIDKKHIEHIKETILKIYKENDETDYVKAMHPKFYGAIWTSKGLIYVAKMNEKGCLELI